MIDSFSQTSLDAEWVAASSTYNYMMKDPLLDWLKYHHRSLAHKEKTYRDSVHNCLSGPKSAYSFIPYIMQQGNEFERKVIKMITKKFGCERVAEIHGETAPKSFIKAEETLSAMKAGIPIIHSGVLRNHRNKTFGVPDLLVRSDWMKFLVQESPLTPALETVSAPKLISKESTPNRLSQGKSRSGKEESAWGKWHYRIVDIKFTGLLLRANALHLLNSGSFPAYKSQLLIYNLALGELQGYTPDQAYILGRRWTYTSKGQTYSGNNCFERLAVIDYKLEDSEYISRTEKAIAWLREVRREESANWNVTHYPLDRWELYPNMCNDHDYPWHSVKEEMSRNSRELTSLWMVGPKNRNIALEKGIFSWSDKACTAESMGITGEKTSKILDAIIRINQSDKFKILPSFVTNNIGGWRHPHNIEFFVDFETCNGIISNIKRLPAAKTETIIFMIGVGYIDPIQGRWVYKDFTVNRLTFCEEARVCHEFSLFVREEARKYGVKRPRCIHWAAAENVMWSSAVQRHNPISNEWKSWMWDWLDLLMVFKGEPIVINGCMSFGLKDVSTAMMKHGFIRTTWDKKSVCDGQSAMIAARQAHVQARTAGTSMKTIPIMKHIIKYNEVDVKVLYEIISYLRNNNPPLISKRVNVPLPTTSGVKRSQEKDSDMPSKRVRTEVVLPASCTIVSKYELRSRSVRLD